MTTHQPRNNKIPDKLPPSKQATTKTTEKIQT